jgi:hypothetical protein
VAFYRHNGEFKAVKASPDGKLANDEQWIKNQSQWLPSATMPSHRELEGSAMGAGQIRRLAGSTQNRSRQQRR